MKVLPSSAEEKQEREGEREREREGKKKKELVVGVWPCPVSQFLSFAPAGSVHSQREKMGIFRFL